MNEKVGLVSDISEFKTRINSGALTTRNEYMNLRKFTSTLHSSKHIHYQRQ